MISLKVLSKNDVMQVVEMQPVIDCVEDVYRQKSSGDAVVWPTAFYEFEPGSADMDIKSGFLKGAELFGHKTVSWFGSNAAQGLPEPHWSWQMQNTWEPCWSCSVRGKENI